MKTVVNANKEVKKVMIGAGVLLSVIVAVLTLANFQVAIRDAITNRPIIPELVVFKQLPIDRVQVARYIAALGFAASPDEIVGQGEESVYRWGERGVSGQFTEVSFKDGFIDYEARVIEASDAEKKAPKVSELKVSNWLAWDFLRSADIWDDRIEIDSNIELFKINEKTGVVSGVTRFEEANLFRVYFVGQAPLYTKTKEGVLDEKYSVLAPDFERYLAKVDVYGPTGQVIAGRIYPIYLGEEMKLGTFSQVQDKSDSVSTIENNNRPEKGFLQEGEIVYISEKGEYFSLWQAQSSTTKQAFKLLTQN